MSPTKLLLCLLALLISPLAASAPTEGRLSNPLTNEPIVSGTIYECRPKHYQPPCRVIGTRPELSDEDSMAQLLAAIRASRTGVPTPILQLGDTGPIEACGNGHGKSACCRVTAVIEDVVIVECG